MLKFFNLPSVLILSAVALLATENYSHYPVGLMSVLGIVALVKDPRLLTQPGIRLLLSVFAAIWLPMVCSLPDAVNTGRAIKTTIAYLHFLPAAIYACHMLREPLVQRTVFAGVAAIVAVWCFDGLLQLIAGRNVFGYPYDGSVLKGMFYPKQRYGLILAVFAPVYFYAVHRLAARTPWAWLLMVPFVVTVTFSLKRTAWIMMIVAVAVYGAVLFRVPRDRIRVVYGVLAALALALIVSFSVSDNLRLQVSGTLAIFSSDFETADVATSHRLSLWKTGMNIARSHWLNGVGPRGYRAAYRAFADPDDFWIARGTKGQTHPHLMVLEVLVETGLIGLLGYLFALSLIAREIWRRRTSAASCAALIAALVAWFPLNAHLAFYGSYWANIAWLMLALGCSAATPTSAPRD